MLVMHRVVGAASYSNVSVSKPVGLLAVCVHFRTYPPVEEMQTICTIPWVVWKRRPAHTFSEVGYFPRAPSAVPKY